MGKQTPSLSGYQGYEWEDTLHLGPQEFLLLLNLLVLALLDLSSLSLEGLKHGVWSLKSCISISS